MYLECTIRLCGVFTTRKRYGPILNQKEDTPFLYLLHDLNLFPLLSQIDNHRIGCLVELLLEPVQTSDTKNFLPKTHELMNLFGNFVPKCVCVFLSNSLSKGRDCTHVIF